MMRHLVFISVCLFLLSLHQENRDIILWQANRPLTWRDFKGRPEKRFAVASTSYDILKNVSLTDEKTATARIEAVFFCKKSWKKEEWISKSVLTHEQKHFDIVELYARKLRKLIKEQHYASFEELVLKVDSLYKTNDEAMDVYQDLYDQETDGSMDGDKQKEWNRRINNEILELELFNSPSFVLFLR